MINYNDVYETIYYSAKLFKLEKNHDAFVRIETNKRTSSCGSVQIMHGNTYNIEDGSIRDIFTKKERLSLIEKIFNYYEKDYKINHFFYIDTEEGIIEQLFGDLDLFKEVWAYRNINTDNIVFMKCHNIYDEDQVHDIWVEINDEET